MTAYGNLCTEFYDLDKPIAPAEALAYYLERAREASGRVLEPMCGSGRFLLPMHQAGILVDGVDSSPAMLEACRRRGRALGLDVRVYPQRLESLDLPHRYAMALIPSSSIGLITEDDNLRKALFGVRSHLERNGTLFLETMGEDGDSPAELEPRTVWCPNGSSITYTCIASRSSNADVIQFSGRYEKRVGMRVVATEAEELALRLYNAERLIPELLACGFRSAKAFAPSELDFLAESGCTLVVARADT